MVVAQLMITYEWSDWRNAQCWLALMHLQPVRPTPCGPAQVTCCGSCSPDALAHWDEFMLIDHKSVWLQTMSTEHCLALQVGAERVRPPGAPEEGPLPRPVQPCQAAGEGQRRVRRQAVRRQ